MSKLPDKYNTQEAEKKWQKYWRENQTYKWEKDLPRSQTFVIDTPPPTVSGLLHMGHIFSYTQADFVARYQRMSGKTVFYPMGFDDNGLPTERLVEKIIGKKAGVYEAENGHGSFVKKCREVVDEAEIEFEELFNSIALSVDWNEKYQTISPESQKISQASFVDLYQKNLVEKKFEPVFWDVSDRTALAQADLVDKEMDGMMNYILFGVEGSDETIEIMTTRPELLPACVAVMVHPDDERYKKFHGKNAVTPLFGVKVKIIPDDLVQMDKGTGAVMCCTFGDETDIRWWKKYKKKYNLPLRIIIGKDGRFDWQLIYTIDREVIANQDYNPGFKDGAKILFDEKGNGKTLKEGKDAIIEALSTKNLIAKPSEKIIRSVKCAERSGVPIEILVVPQWFIKILDKKEQLKEKARECKWHPDYMRIRIEQWIDGLQWDWCISRQRFFGVKFPVWHVKKSHDLGVGETIVADIDQLPIDPLQSPPKGFENYKLVHQSDKSFIYEAIKDGEKYTIIPETDIMDTWATSSISPQLSSKGISKEICFDQERHQKLFPADMRPQAHEIIRTWAFYTIAKAMLHEDQIPWKNLMISGWCLAADKSKMSKSKGNVITPNSLIEEKGSDIVRYWASTSHLGADTAYSEETLKIGGKLLNKLFNATKFAALNFSELKEKPTSAKEDIAKKIITEASDLWILSRLSATIKKATEDFKKFEYARAREAIEYFFWNDLCDNYLEIVKVRAYGLKAQKYENILLDEKQKLKIVLEQQSGITTLYNCLDAVIRLFAPFIPHITEELYQGIFDKNESIHRRGNWPKATNYFEDTNSFIIGDVMLEVIFNVRKFKSDNNLSMKVTVSKIIITSPIDITLIRADLANVCNALEVEVIKGETIKVEIII